MSELFKLRGNLTAQQSLQLPILGVVILIGFWWILAFAKSEMHISVNEFGEFPIEDSTYFNNDDSIHYNKKQLLKKSDEELAALGLVKERVYSDVPTPMRVTLALQELYQNDKLIQNSAWSIWLNLLGYFFAILISIPVGFALGLIPLFRGLFNNIFEAFRFIPLTAMTSIFIIWFGLGTNMKVAFLAFGIIVYLVPVVVQRIDEVQSVYLKTVFTLRATSWQTIQTVYIPSVISRLSDDIRVLTAISWTYITIVELLRQEGGIGGLIYLARRQSRIDKAFAVLIVIVLIGIIQDRILVWLDKVLFPYKYTERKRY